MLDALHNDIVARLRTDLPGAALCDAYPDLRQRVPLPAVLVDLDELIPADFGGDLPEYYARFGAYCIADHALPTAQRDVRNLAVTVAARVYQERDFGAADVVRGAQLIRVGPDFLRPDLEGYLGWVVEFQLGVQLGESAWLENPTANVPVTQVFVGELDAINLSNRQGTVDTRSQVTEINLPEQPKGSQP